jgi:hypothetical protein
MGVVGKWSIPTTPFFINYRKDGFIPNGFMAERPMEKMVKRLRPNITLFLDYVDAKCEKAGLVDPAISHFRLHDAS